MVYWMDGIDLFGDSPEQEDRTATRQKQQNMQTHLAHHLQANLCKYLCRVLNQIASCL